MLGEDSFSLNTMNGDLEEEKVMLEEKIKKLQETLLNHNKIIEEYEKSFEEKLKEEKQKEKKERVENDYSVPHLYNLNEDPLLVGKIYHNISQINQFFIGRKKGNLGPQIQLYGIGIKDNHCVFEREGDHFFLSPLDEGASDNLFLNGEKVE